MKRSLRICATMLAVLLLIGGAGGFSSTVSVRAADNGALRTWAGTPIVHHVGGYDTAVRTLHTLVYDFLAPDIGSYASDSLSAPASSSAMITHWRRGTYPLICA